ncbi:MAG TPA: DNA repair protein RecO [Gemmatimonadaceae bacterium]|jgi:DNA repair protein RecO (recombination protein O)
MSLVVTDAIVLHAFDYLESSRILKLVTRDFGVRSVLARGARRSKKRFGSALDLYAQGAAQLQMKPGRELDTLADFDVARARPQIARDLSRFAGSSAIAELTLRFAGGAGDPGLFEAVESALDAIGIAPPDETRAVTLAGAWRVLRELGIAPTVDTCAECHARVDPTAQAMFSHPAGGTLCERCGHLARSGRRLPPSARTALRQWLNGDEHSLMTPDEGRAHQRLLREFLREHLAEDRPLRAFDAWERDTLTTTNVPHEARP